MKNWFEGKTVSVVGNAESIMSLNYGKEIDSADVVVRINRGGYRFIDFTKQMGNRLDVWCMQNVKQNKKFFDKPHTHKAKKMQMDTLEVSPDFINMVDHVYDTKECKLLSSSLSKKPSTGLRVLDYVFRANPKCMFVYGFDWKETFSWHEKRKCIAHNFEEEKKYCEKTFFINSNCILRK